MKNILLALFAINSLSSAFAQKEVKYVKMYYKNTSLENTDLIISVENAVSTDPFLTPEQAKIWLSAIRSVSTDLFDEFALSELGADRSMSKRIKARHKLTGWLFSKKPTNPICAFMAENNFET